MKLLLDQLTFANSPLYGFVGELAMPEGTITLPVLMGTLTRQVSIMVYFFVMKVPSAYKAIIG